MNKLTLALVLLIGGCRVDGGDGDAEVDADFDDGDVSDVQHCEAPGGVFACLAEHACCVDIDGFGYCCAAGTECDDDGGCVESCDPGREAACDEAGEGGAIACDPAFNDGPLVCRAGDRCWNLVLEPCESGECQEVGGGAICR